MLRSDVLSLFLLHVLALVVSFKALVVESCLLKWHTPRFHKIVININHFIKGASLLSLRLYLNHSN
jgi:hypothetical protein